MPGGIWFKCVGCGEPAAYFPEPWDTYPAGVVAHSKPQRLRRKWGEPSNVPCELYQLLTAEEFWNANRDSERIDPPEKMEAS